MSADHSRSQTPWDWLHIIDAQRSLTQVSAMALDAVPSESKVKVKVLKVVEEDASGARLHRKGAQ